MDKITKLRYGVRIFQNSHQNRINKWLESVNEDLVDFSVEKIMDLSDHLILFYYSFIGYNDIEEKTGTDDDTIS